MKIHLIDPTCILKYGHNMPALLRYNKICLENGYESFIHVCQDHLDKSLTNLNMDLEHCYGFGGVVIPEDPVEASMRNVEKFIDDSNEKKVLFFINIDYFSILALDRLTEKIKHSNINLIVRLIGVMENDIGGSVDDQKFIPYLKKLKFNLGSRLKIGTETLAYSEFITNSIGYEVEYMPFPLMDFTKPTKKESTTNLTFGFLGAPREDKGYPFIPSIINNLYSQDANTKFIIQGEEGSDCIWDSISEKYRSNIQYFKSPLEHSLIFQLLRQCSVLILPYDEVVYKKRGSAMLFEAIEVGVPSITIGKPAFSKEIEIYGLGIVYDSIGDINLNDVCGLIQTYKDRRNSYINLTNLNFIKSLEF